MIPVEYFWGVLFLIFAIIGAARGLHKELGASTILLLSLFALWLGWDQASKLILSTFKQGPLKDFNNETIMALYYGVTIVLLAFVSYEGVVLQFPVQKIKGLLKGPLGALGGLLNGYLIVGTVWDVIARADYLKPTLSVVTDNLSDLHSSVVQYLPVTFMDRYSPFIILVMGLILLVGIVLK